MKFLMKNISGIQILTLSGSHFFEKEGLFYARLPSMVDELGDSLANRLKTVINEHKVKSIVIDIRGNGGGSATGRLPALQLQE